MRKLLLILLILFFSTNSFALKQEEVIEKHLSNRKLSPIEGIWYGSGGRIYGAYKTGGNNYLVVIIHNMKFDSGEAVGNLKRITDNEYMGSWIWTWKKSLLGKRMKKPCESFIVIKNGPPDRNTTAFGPNIFKETADKPCGFTTTDKENFARIWPKNFNAHNANLKEETSESVATKSESTASKKSIKEIVAAGIKMGDDISNYKVLTTGETGHKMIESPDPISLIRLYGASVTNENKIYQITLHGYSHKTKDGSQCRDDYDKIKSAVNKKYGYGRSNERMIGDSKVFSKMENFVYSIHESHRYHSTEWDFNNVMIRLRIIASSLDECSVGVLYQNKKYEEKIQEKDLEKF